MSRSTIIMGYVVTSVTSTRRRFADPHRTRSRYGSPLGSLNNRPIIGGTLCRALVSFGKWRGSNAPSFHQRTVQSLILLYFCKLCRIQSIPEIRSPKNRIHNNLIFRLSLSTFLTPFLRSKLSPLLRKHKR